MMDITELPEHIFIDIAKYLSADDLLSCSLVNATWRETINCNDIWRHICKTSTVSKTGEELDHIPNLVADFVEPFSAPDFEPLCKWRKTFMRWKKLKSNWLTGNFKQYPINESISTFCAVECDDNLALIVYNDLREISVWNVKGNPYRQEVIKFCLNHVCSEFVKLCNNYLVIVQCNLLQVFYYSESDFELYYRSIFDKQESHMEQLPTVHNISDWYRANINLYPCDLTLRCEQNGVKFVGANLDDDCNNAVLHIWDLKTKRKDAEVSVPTTSDSINDISLAVTDTCLYLMITNCSSNSYYNSLHVYDFKELKFIDFSIQFTYIVPEFVVNKDTVIAVDSRQHCVNIWGVKRDFKKTISCKFQIDLRCFNIDRLHLLIGGRSAQSTTICVYSLSDFRLTFTLDVLYTVDFVSLIQNRFLILGALSSNYFCSIIDMPKGCFLYTIDHHDCIFVNSIHSKLVTRFDNELSMISFW